MKLKGTTVGLLALVSGGGLMGACGSAESGDSGQLSRQAQDLDAYPDKATLELSAAIEDDGSGRGPLVYRSHRRWSQREPTSDERQLLDQPAGEPSSPFPGAEKDSVLAELRSRESGQVVSISFGLEETALARRELPGPEVERAVAVQQREAAVRPTQDRFVGVAESWGAKTTSRSWLGNVVTIEASVKTALQLAELPSVRSVSLSEAAPVLLADQDLCNVPLGGNNIGLDGDSYRVGSRLTYLNSAYSADTGGRTGGRVKVAVIDATFPVRNHHAWRFSSGSPTADRILVSKVCTGTGCTTSTPAGETGHGNATAQWAVGNVMNSQDSNCTTTTAKQRSGSRAAGAYLLYYEVFSGAGNFCDKVRLALQDAVSNGADIVNMSLGTDEVGCNNSFDCGGLNAAIRSATDAGTLIFASAGNSGNGSCSFGSCATCATSCCVVHPARRPEVVAVGGLQTYNRLQDYNTYDRDGNSSRGGMTTTLTDGTSGTESLIGLMGPYSVNFTGASGPNLYANSGATVASGTSFSSPTIAGAAAMVLDGFRSLGWATSARTLRLNLLMMGDAANSASTDLLSGTSTTWGYGRLHAAVPDATWATAPRWWAQSPFTLQPGVIAQGCVNSCNPMPSSVQQYNWVFYYEPSSWTSVPRIWINIVDLNTNTVVAADYSTSTTKRIQLRSPNIAGRRLQLQVMPISLPSAMTVYSGDFFHSDASGWTYH